MRRVDKTDVALCVKCLLMLSSYRHMVRHVWATIDGSEVSICRASVLPPSEQCPSPHQQRHGDRAWVATDLLRKWRGESEQLILAGIRTPFMLAILTGIPRCREDDPGCFYPFWHSLMEKSLCTTTYSVWWFARCFLLVKSRESVHAPSTLLPKNLFTDCEALASLDRG